MENEQPKGNLVTYDPLPIKVRRGRRELLGLVGGLAALFVVALVGAILMHNGHHSAGLVAWVLAAGMGLVGANTIAYDANGTIPSGATPPTAIQANGQNQISAVITGDGATTTFTVVHNWGLTAAQLTAAQPNFWFEELLAAGYTAAPLLTSRATNQLVFSCTAFTGAGLRIVMKRPMSTDM